MVGNDIRVGVVHAGPLSDEQRAAVEWLTDRPGTTVVTLRWVDVAAGADTVDVLWWHRDAPVRADTLAPTAVENVVAFLSGGGGLLLTLQGMAAVDTLGIDPVAPDRAGIETVDDPTGVLWRRVHDDHPAVAAFDDLRIPVCDRATVPTARYERRLPAHGEILAGTVRDGVDVPDRMTAVAWDHVHATDAGGGTVLGVGTPLAFAEPAADPVAAGRDALTAGCLHAVTSEKGRDRPRRPATASDLRSLRTRVADASARPTYHFTPPANWLNDPNGLIEWNGQYHLFYQYNPAGPFHNTIHWGHAVSDDLVHWRDQPVALTPSPDGPDRHGCWSGCAIDDDGTAALLYTGGDGRWQLPCLATSDDPGLRRWDKYPDNPVIETPPSDPDLLETDDWAVEFRDHSVWREDGVWYQVIGTGVTGVGGAAVLYSATDLREWHYEGPLLIGDDGHGTVWECPEVLDLGDAHLLHVSDGDTVVYRVGDLEDGCFETRRRGVLDPGDFYAPQSLRDGDRYVTWGWLPETRSVSAQWDAGWSGALSLPRVLDLGADGRLRQRPAPAVDRLRERRRPTAPPTQLDDERHALSVTGRTLELDVTVSLVDAEAFELSVFEAADGSERTPIRYTRAGELVVDRTTASRHDVGAATTQRITVPPYDGSLSLRCFLDGSVIELYANDRRCLTSRVYPEAESTGLSIAAEGGQAIVDSLTAWDLGAAVE